MANAKPQCISGTFHNDGAAIHNHVRKQQSTSLLAAPGEIRRKRKPAQWRKMYAQAMAEKRGQGKLV